MKSNKKIALGLMSIVTAGVAAAGATGTFAWFAVNNKVVVSGMTVKTSVSSNLSIATDELASTARAAEGNFGTSVATAREAVLEPASTTNGTTFFYTVNAKADGAAAAEVYTQYDASATASDSTTYADAFSETYSVSKTGAAALIAGQDRAYPYVDYIFQVKAVATSASYINLSTINLFAPAKDATTAMRAAVFAEDITSANPAGGVGTLKTVLEVNGALNQTTDKAVTSTTTLGEVTNHDASAVIANVTAGSTTYHKIVVRMWLEGEDKTCRNDTFLALSDAWTLELALTLETTNTSAKNIITKYRTATVSSTTYYYESVTGYIWSNKDDIGNTSAASAVSAASADASVKTAFGI